MIHPAAGAVWSARRSCSRPARSPSRRTDRSWIRMGDSIVLVTVVSRQGEEGGHRLLPAHRRLPGEARSPRARSRAASSAARAGPPRRRRSTSRIIDRSCRPLFPEGYQNETQIIATVSPSTRRTTPTCSRLTGASAALQLSDIPFDGPDRRRPRRPRRRQVRRQPHPRAARGGDLDIDRWPPRETPS